MTAPGRSEAGVIATQLAVLMPALLLLVMLGVQFGLWAHATQLADAAADAAARAGALPAATPGDGQAAATAILNQAGNLSHVVIDVDRGAEQVTARVAGTAPNVVPGLRWRVEAHAAAAVEVFVAQDER